MIRKKKILMAIGTRPEAIKMAPLYHAFSEKSNLFEVFICVTAQHREMLDQVLRIFRIVPDFDLNIMKPEQDLSGLTSNILLGMRDVLKNLNPDIVLVHGDTTTAFGSAVAAFYQGISIGHVEAGLRTHNMLAPFPEEFNRQVISRISKWHFAPTESSRANLRSEGVDDSDIEVTGNTVIDALFWTIGEFENNKKRQSEISNLLNKKLSFDWVNSRFILITGHRRENFGKGFLEICYAIKRISEMYPNLHLVYPVHLNPNVLRPVSDLLGNIHNVHLIEPLGYEPFIFLLKKCFLVLTDSGGIQEEAPSLGKPVLVMRDETERPEGVEAGVVRLVGANSESIIDNVVDLMVNDVSYSLMTNSKNPYGDGMACKKIISFLEGI